MMRVMGEVVAIGHLTEDEVRRLSGLPAFHLKTPEGRCVTVAGLTREECVNAGAYFLDPVSLTLEGLE